MSKFELFKKLNLLIQISGIADNPLYCGMLNVARPSPSDAFRSQFAEDSDLVSGVNNDRIDTYPNPMAVKYLMNVCEDVLLSKVPNRKDEFQLATLAFQLAVSRLSSAVGENKLYEFHDCEPLTQNYNNGLASGSSLGNELRHLLDTFKLNSEYIESAVSNTLTYPDNSGYVKRLDIDPKICVLFPFIDEPEFINVVKYTMFGEPQPTARAPLSKAPARESTSVRQALIILGIVELEVNLADDEAETKLQLTLLGRSLLKDFETALDLLSSNPRNGYKVDPTWYGKYIEVVPNLDRALAQLLAWDSFYMYDLKGQHDKFTKLRVPAGTTVDTLADEGVKASKISSKARIKSEKLLKDLDNVSIRLALIQFGLVVRNPLYDARDSILKHNAPLILSGFGIAVAQYSAKCNETAEEDPDMKDADDE